MKKRSVTKNYTTPIDRVKKIKAHQPSKNPYFNLLLSSLPIYKIDGGMLVPLFQKAVTYEKAVTILKSIPHFSEKKSLRAIGKIYNVSGQTIKNYRDEYGEEVTDRG